MDSPFNTADEDIPQFIANPEPLKEGYTPSEILERDDVIEDYRRYLQPVLTGGSTQNIFVRGPTGVGKTAITRRMLSFLASEAADAGVPLESVYLNVRSKSTYETLLELANELHEGRFPRGTNTSQLKSAIFDEIDRIGGYFILTIDECDHLDEEGEAAILYEFPRARANNNVSNTQIGLIGISNNLTYGSELEPRIKSSLTEREIEFTPYDANELFKILNYYADLAFRDGVVDESALKYISAKVAQDKGDARAGLDILELSVEVAKKRGDVKLTDTHARTALDRYATKKKVRRVREFLTPSQSIGMAVLTVAEARGETPATLAQLKEQYDALMTAIGRDTRTKDSIREYLQTLAMYGFAQEYEENRGPRGGRKYTYDLEVDTETAIEGLSSNAVAASVLEQEFDFD